MYQVITSQKERELDTRKEAVRTAKKLSRRRHESVTVVRPNVERMIFKNGRLEEGVYITQDRRRRSSSRAR